MVVNGGLLIRPLGSLCPLTAIWLQSGGRNDSVATADPEFSFSANAAYLEPSGSQNGPESEPTDADFAEFVIASELIVHGFPVSSSSLEDDLQGHPSGVEPAGSGASVAASLHMT